MMLRPDGPCAEIGQAECPDCHALITAQNRVTRPCSRVERLEEFFPVFCRHCGFNWSLQGEKMARWVEFDFTPFRASAKPFQRSVLSYE